MDRICKKCKETKPIEDFSKDKKCNLGYSHNCKKCHNIKSKKNKENNIERVRELKRQFYYNHKIDICEKNKNNPRRKEWRDLNKDKIKIVRNRRLIENKEMIILKRSEDNKRMSKEITDEYIYHIIKASTGIKYKDIKKYPELIESYRQQIKVKRLLKSIKNENKQTS